MARGQRFLVVAALMALGTGCAKQGSTRAEPVPSSDVESPRTGAPDDMGMPPNESNPPPSTGGSTSQIGGMTDGQAAQVLQTIHRTEIDSARDAMQRSSNPDVQAYAQQMIVDHEGANAQVDALNRTASLSPEASDLSRQLDEQSNSLKSAMGDLEQSAFDQAYLSSEVQMHAQTLQILDQVLMPKAMNAELRSVLEGLRPTVSRHLEQAQALYQQFQGTSTDTLSPQP